MDVNFAATKKLWSEIYNLEYRVPGGMYRGEPPSSFFDRNWVIRAAVQKFHSDHCQEDILPHGVTYTHLIGEVGASSVGRESENNLNPDWMSVDSPDGFIEPSPKSTTKGENANEKRDNYVFGRDGTCNPDILGISSRK